MYIAKIGKIDKKEAEKRKIYYRSVCKEEILVMRKLNCLIINYDANNIYDVYKQVHNSHFNR